MSRLHSITLYLIFCWIWGLCCSFVLLSSAEGAAETNLFEPGKSWTYNLDTTVLLNEHGGKPEKDVGFYINGKVKIESKWGKDDEKLLKISLQDPKLHIRSRPVGFVHHGSLIESLNNQPFYLHWHNGKIQKLLLAKDELLPLANLKKGIASLLQFQILDQESIETDASGQCLTTYTSNSPKKLTKTKMNCQSPDLPYIRNPEPLLDAKVTSIRKTSYILSETYIETITCVETHSMSLSAREEVGNEIISKQEFKYIESGTTDIFTGGSFFDVYQKMDAGPLREEVLTLEMEYIASEDPVLSFTQTVDTLRDSLKEKNLGKLVAAKSFLKLVNVARRSSKDDIAKALTSKKNQKIMHQLVDILGYVQSSNSHGAITKRLHFDDKKQEELNERYLWALQSSTQPNPEIIIDLLNKFKKTQNIDSKVKETMIMSIAAMAYHLSKLDATKNDPRIHREVENTLVNYLDASKGESRYPFLRALRNLRSSSTTPTLLKLATSGTLKEGVLAWKALKAMEPEKLSPEVFKSATKTFLQIDKKHDSSSRTLALDIILESNPCEETLRHILYYIISNDKDFEVKQYALQRLRMLMDTDKQFAEKVMKLVKEDQRLYNYASWGQKGLSVALTRPFVGGKSSNGSLLTIQEMSSGIVKRGIVNVMMDKDGFSQEIFSLGVFTGGLGSLLSSEENEGESEDAVAGMELSVLGNQIRPFVFFTGQGELMGHVWSGTASDRTTAFQGLAMLQDHYQLIRLGSGFIAELDIKGALSFDLSGQIQISLWNRNAESLVEKSAGILINGLLRIDSTFVRSQVEFSVSIEPKLKLETDIDFSSNMSLCMRLTQPDSKFKHNIYKIERIPGSKHKLRRTKYLEHPAPGKTYALNRKNTDMCNMIFG